MKDLQKLFENYLRSIPVRSPFSQTNYYSGGQKDGGSFQDYTDLYNATYRTHYEGAGEEEKGGFENVMYSEPLNVLVAYPKEGAERFEEQLNENECLVKFGLKAARGFKKDYRFLDHSIPGAGKLAVSEEDADRVVEEPFKAIREMRPKYTRNFGETPVERIDESAQRKINGLVREELGEMLSESVDIIFSEPKKVCKLIRKRQLEEELSRFEDAALDICANSVREGTALSSVEAELLKETMKRYE